MHERLQDFLPRISESLSKSVTRIIFPQDKAWDSYNTPLPLLPGKLNDALPFLALEKGELRGVESSHDKQAYEARRDTNPPRNFQIFLASATYCRPFRFPLKLVFRWSRFDPLYPYPGLARTLNSVDPTIFPFIRNLFDRTESPF